MLLRAVFWIGLVSLLMPHEPDLGFGRPHAGPALPTVDGAWMKQAVAAPGAVCTQHAAGCQSGASMLDSFRLVALRSLEQVKADIERSQRERLEQTRAF